MTTRARSAAAVWLLACGACSQREPEAVVHHQASSRIVIRESDVDFRIEGVERGGAIPLSDSTFALLDYRGRQVVVMDTMGVIVRRIGRAGGGPGEILFAQHLVRLRNGIGVVDGAKDALVTFSLDGREPEQHSLKELLGTSAVRLTGLVQLDDSSWFFSENARLGATQYERLVRRSGSASVVVDSSPPVRSRSLVFPCNVTVAAAGPPVYFPTLRWTSDNRGRSFTVVSDAYNIRYSGTATISLPVLPRAASASEAKRLPLGSTVKTPSASCELTSEAALEQRGMAPTIPVIARVVASPDGWLWVLREAPPVRQGIVDRFDATGRHVDSSPAVPFPAFFLTDSTYVSAKFTDDGVTLLLVRVRSQRPDLLPGGPIR